MWNYMAYRVLFPVCDTSRYDAVCEIHDLVTDWKEYRDADSRFYWLPFQKEKELSRDELIKSSLPVPLWQRFRYPV
jgi:hypothetical protein